MSKQQTPIDVVISRLGYDNSANLVKYDQYNDACFCPSARKIIKAVNPYAVYIVDELPFVAFFNNFIDESFKDISKKVWNAQIPIVIVCDEGTVKVFNGTSLDSNEKTLKKVDERGLDDCDAQSAFSFWRITDTTFWNQYVGNFTENRLNQSLLDNITFLTNQLKSKFHISFATKLVLRLIFIRYLIDRGVDLDYEGFSSNVEESQAEFLNIIGEKNKLYQLFAYLQSKFNGNLFDLSDELSCDELGAEVFELLYDFFTGKIVMDNGQKALFSLYDFNIIPVELISNIYEILLGKETRDADNAFYTPNYLVEYILDNTIMGVLKKKKCFSILDPACGSGVFLVDSYRRIIEENLGDAQYCEDDTLLNRLLVDNIYGIDINEEAIDVTIFSLYLTILDYKDPKSLSQFVLPNLKGINLFVNDFFDEDALETFSTKGIAFDFIIGNPPWGNVKTGLHTEYCKKHGYKSMQQNNEISRSFVFRAKDFSNPNTICCFILHSKVLYNQKQPAIRFRRFLLERTKIYRILELSSVRKLVFENADAPAAIVTFQYNQMNNLDNKFTYISVKPNVFFRLFHVFVIEKSDIKSISQALLYKYDWAWKTIVYGSSNDLRIVLNLKNKYRTLGSVIEAQTPAIIKGAGVEYQDGDKNDATHLLGKRLLNSNNGVEHFIVNSSNTSEFVKPKIHRPRDQRLFEPPYVLVPTGVDCDNYKLKAAYSEEAFVARKTMYIIKGEENQKAFFLNLVGLLNSSLYSYLNLMTGTSIGIEREQRFMEEVLAFPYLFSDLVVKMVDTIQKQLYSGDEFEDIRELVERLDHIILSEFSLAENSSVDYALNIQIPELTNTDKTKARRNVTAEDLKRYSEVFSKQFTEIYNPLGKYITIVVYPSVGRNYAVFELRITDEKENQIQVSTTSDEDAEILTRFSIHEYNDKFYTIRDVIQFGEDYLYIIKPKSLKNWHPAIAELDLADVIDQIMSGAGGEA